MAIGSTITLRYQNIKQVIETRQHGGSLHSEGGIIHKRNMNTDEQPKKKRKKKGGKKKKKMISSMKRPEIYERPRDTRTPRNWPHSRTRPVSP